MVRGPECLERGDDERDLIDRAVDPALEVPLQPACRHAAAPTGVGLRDQGGELEQVAERRPRDLRAQHRLRDCEVPALDRPFEDRPRMPLYRQRALPRRLGPDGWGESTRCLSARLAGEALDE